MTCVENGEGGVDGVDRVDGVNGHDLGRDGDSSSSRIKPEDIAGLDNGHGQFHRHWMRALFSMCLSLK